VGGDKTKNFCRNKLKHFIVIFTFSGRIRIMKSLRRDIVLVLIFLLFIAGLITASEYSYSNIVTRQAKAAVITCKGDIDYGLYQSIKRRTKYALKDGATYLIYEIGTYGGLLKSADDISKFFILDVPRLSEKAHTVAYVTTEAISAGSMISVSCRDIIMRENTTIGDCAPINLGGSLEGVEREKTESFTRAAFERAAEANGYPVALLRAMVTMQIEVYRVKNLDTDKYEFFENTDLPKDSNNYDLAQKELVDSSGELLTLTASKAKEYGIAREVVQDLPGVLAFLAKRDGVQFTNDTVMLDTTWSEEVARWLNSPAVMAVLVLLALLGVYMEFSSPGLGLPGLVAVICFVLIIGSKYISGLANWFEVFLFFAGLILVLVELFVIPGFGITGITGIILIIVGLFGMLIKNAPNEIPWPQDAIAWRDFNHGIIGLSIGLGGFVICAWLLSKYLPKIPYLGGMILVPDTSKIDGVMPVNMTMPLESETKELEIGDSGEVISMLRPAGKAKFGDAIVDVVAEGDFINKGASVEITEIHGNRVVVKFLT
jgi:membrane-bound serine protease (ClpP class)